MGNCVRLTFLQRASTLGFALIGLLLMSDARAQTEAEAAAASQRELTETEKIRRDSDCRLPTGGDVLSQFGSAISATRVSLPAQRILVLIIYDTTGSTETHPVKVAPYPDLPSGGIGGRDICDTVVFGEIAGMQNLTAVGLRLRPGLDLEKDYPTALPQIRENGQVTVFQASEFARIDIADGSQVPLFVTALADQPMIAADRRFFLIENSLYVPLRR